MRHLLVTALAIALLPAGSWLSAQSRATATNVPIIPHEAVPNFFKNPPGIYTGENMGIATSSKGNIYIYHRAYETRLFEYTPQGQFVREIGRNNYGFSFAHSVRVDAQDNIWAVDEGTDMLVKFSPEGRVLMTIGRREDPVAMLSNMPGSGSFHGRNEKYRFGRQTDVAFDQQGNIFVSDGYFDGRVVKYDKNGRFVKAVGTRGKAELQFNTPHSIATDFQGNVYVGDRGNARVQVLDNNLGFKAMYTQRRQSVGGVRVWRAGAKKSRQAVSLRVELVARQRPGRTRGVHRRGLQDGTGRHHRRQVRPRRQGGRRVLDHSPDGLPRSRRDLHGGDQQLAFTKNSAQATADENHQPAVRGGAMTRIITTIAVAAILSLGGTLVAQSGVPDISFNATDLLRTPAEGPFVGEVGGVGANSKGQIFVYTRTGHPYATLGDNRTFSRGGSKLFLFDANGKFVREWGQDVYGFNAAIGLRVDPQDNVWTIDAAANQVVKFNPDGSVGLVLGRKPETIPVRPNAPPAGGTGCNRCTGCGWWRRRRRRRWSRGRGSRARSARRRLRLQSAD